MIPYAKAKYQELLRQIKLPSMAKYLLSSSEYVPGICTSLECSHRGIVHCTETQGPCSVCGENKIVSGLVLMLEVND